MKSIRLYRTIHDACVEFSKPLVWSLSMLPDLMLRMITAACAGLLVVFVFGGGMIVSHSLFPHQALVLTVTDIPFDNLEFDDLE